jgi:hypothetical protein
VLVLTTLLGACAHGPPYRVQVTESYEVGEDITVALRVRELTDDDAVIIVTRPDGTIIKEHAPLDVEHSKIRFGRPAPHPGVPATFTETGPYRVELKTGDTVLAKDEVVVKVNHLDELLPMRDVADYKQITRYTKVRLYGKKQWKTYGAIYVQQYRPEARVEIVIEEPGSNMKDAWKPYFEVGTVTVIEDNNVIFREGADVVTASWISDSRIIAMRAPTLADLERGMVAHFLNEFPSKLDAK